MANYTNVAEMAARLGVSIDATGLSLAIDAAEAAAEDYCGRVFTLQTSTTTRHFCAYGYRFVDVDDIAATTGLVVADTNTTHTNYQLEPLDGQWPNGRPGPYTRIRLLSEIFAYPIWPGQATVTITARWGWPSVPAPVADAVRILAGDLFKMKDNAFGVAGFNETGVMMIRQNAMVANLLAIYRNVGSVVGIG
jgi:hypothetical protein